MTDNKALDIKDIEHINIDSQGGGIEEALKSVEDLAKNLDISAKDKFHMRLLAEEALGMIKAIISENDSESGDFKAEFWTEWQSGILTWKSGGIFKIFIKADAEVDYEQRRELIAVSSNKKNIAPRGIMEKVRELVEAGLHGVNEILKIQTEYGGGAINYGLLGAMDVQQMMYSWSMSKYKNQVKDNKNNLAWEEAWDELEKSIIANIADDIQVGVNANHVEIVVIKEFLN